MYDIDGKKIIKKLNENGFKAYFIGGCVRDNLLKREVCDYDVTTDAKPEQIIELFSDHKLVLKGLKHGTVGVVKRGKLFEVTSFRIDGEYKDNRHPENVIFSSDLRQDVIRRDFTINSIACDGNKYIDYLGGISDLNDKIIRTCGEPEKRFKEDGLRILRAMRFQAQLGFKIEKNTHQAMKKCAYLLKNISVERIYSELTKTLTGDYAEAALFDNAEVLFEVVPELKPLYNLDQNNPSHNLDAFRHTLKAVGLTPKDAVLRWTALLHDTGKACTYSVGKDGNGHFYGHMKYSKKIAVEVLTRLKASKNMIKQVSTLCGVHDEKLDTKYKIKSFLSDYGTELFEKLLSFKHADLFAHSEYGITKYLPVNEKTERAYDEIISNGECYKLCDLKISGKDLLQNGIGGNYSQILSDVFDKVIASVLPNEKQSLINYVKRNYIKKD